MQREERTIILPVSKKEVVIREGDGYMDRILLKKNKSVYEVFPEYLAMMCVSIDGKDGIKAKDIMDLLSPDQESLALECYKLNYGNMFEFRMTCPACSHEDDYSFDINDLEFIHLPSDLEGPDPTLTVVLPRTGKTAVIGMLNGHKERVLLDQASQGGLDLNQADFQALRSLDGRSDFTYEDVVNLPLADHKAIRLGRRKLVTGYDTNIVVKCQDCGEKVTFNMLMHKDFLLPGG